MLKIQLTIVINFINKIEFMLYDNANEVVNELFESLLSRYEIGLEKSMRGNNFISDSVQLLYFEC